MSVTLQNSNLTGTGSLVEYKVTNGVNSLDIYIDDNGGGSTVTFESAPDGSTWTALSTGVYTLSASGVFAALGGSTTTAKGRYVIDCNVAAYVRARVSTYVSGNVISRWEESVVSLKGLIAPMLVTGLVAQGSTQATALPLQAVYNVFATVAASTGAILPAGVPKNSEVVVKNGGANALAVYPPAGYVINTLAANASISIAAGSSLRFISDGAGNFWTF